MSLWGEGNLEPILLQYSAGDIEGELSGKVADIFGEGQVDLRYTTRGDRFNTAGKLLGLSLDFDLEATSFFIDAELQGNWQGISLTHAVGAIAGHGIQVDITGEVRDLFRRNELDFDLRARSDSLNDLMATLGQSPLIDGTADMTAHLVGRLRGELGLTDVGIELRTTAGLANAEGVVRGLSTTAQSENIGAELQLSFEILTEDLRAFAAVVDYQMPIDGTGTAEGQLIRSDGHYRVENLSLTANAPELSLRATGTVDTLDSVPEFTLQVTGRSPDLARLLQVWSWGWSPPAGVRIGSCWFAQSGCWNGGYFGSYVHCLGAGGGGKFFRSPALDRLCGSPGLVIGFEI